MTDRTYEDRERAYRSWVILDTAVRAEFAEITALNRAVVQDGRQDLALRAEVLTEHRRGLMVTAAELATAFDLWGFVPCPSGAERARGGRCSNGCDTCGGYGRLSAVIPPARPGVLPDRRTS